MIAFFVLSIAQASVSDTITKNEMELKKDKKDVRVAGLREDDKKFEFNTFGQWQTEANMDANSGALRISPIGEVLGHPSEAQRSLCVKSLSVGKNFDPRSCKNDMQGGFKHDKASCEASFMMRHRRLGQLGPSYDATTGEAKDATGGKGEDNCNLQGEVQDCVWQKDSIACGHDESSAEAGEGKNDCGEGYSCTPGGTAQVCPLDTVVLVDCS